METSFIYITDTSNSIIPNLIVKDATITKNDIGLYVISGIYYNICEAFYKGQAVSDIPYIKEILGIPVTKYKTEIVESKLQIQTVIDGYDFCRDMSTHRRLYKIKQQTSFVCIEENTNNWVLGANEFKVLNRTPKEWKNTDFSKTYFPINLNKPLFSY